MKLAAIYARTNTPDSDITTQLDACLKYAFDHGYKVVELYTDVVAPSHLGDNLKKRPGLKRLIKDSKGQPKFSTLIVYDKTRISRSRYDLLIMEKKLSRNGISLVTSTQPPFNSSESVLLESFIAGIDEYYSKNLSLRRT